MGTNMNFNHFGDEPPFPAAASGGGGGGGRPAGNFPLIRQGSIYSLTFDELQNTMGGNIGKDFGSMNMDELLKNIWTAEESQALAAVAGGGQSGVVNSGGYNLQRQGSVTLPRTLSQKTVDEIWKDMSKDGGGGGTSVAPGGGFTQRQPTLGEITLEEFLVRAGVVREEANTIQNLGTNGNNGVGGGGFYNDLMRGNNNTGASSNGMGGFGFQPAGLMSNSNQMMMQSANLPLKVNGVRSSHQQSLATSQPQQQPLFPKQPLQSYANPLGSPRLRGGLVGLGDPVLMQGGGLGMSGLGAGAGAVTVASGSPAQLSSDGLGKSNGDLSSLSPVPYMFNGGIRGRKANGAVEKVVERRQRRMIKNRESAARSRARKQAYTMELEAEVAKLKEENQELQKKQAEIMEMQKNQVLEMMNNQGGAKRQCLRRTQTGPW